MASDSFCFSGDLRQPGVAKQREKEHRAKYRNFLNSPGPVRDQFAGTNREKTKLCLPYSERHWLTAREHNKQRMAIRGENRRDIEDLTPAHVRSSQFDASRDPNSSSDEEVSEGSDEGITYSYDAPSGPQNGNTILGYAVAQAVEKFEKKELEKLVRNEYEVVDGIGHGAEVTEDEGFELV